MAFSRKTKKLFKAYAGWKAVRYAASFGVLPAAGMAIYQLMKQRKSNAQDVAHS